jgi:hypothetical protein
MSEGRWQFPGSIFPKLNTNGSLPLAFGNIKMQLAVCQKHFEKSEHCWQFAAGVWEYQTTSGTLPLPFGKIRILYP